MTPLCREVGANAKANAKANDAVAVAGGTRGLKARSKPKSKAKGRLCSALGCTKQVQQGGVCCRHGAKTTRASCSSDGCSNVAKRGGLCRRHGAFELETCLREGCKRVAKEGKYCESHGGRDRTSAKKRALQGSSKDVERRACRREGCSYKARKGGFCGRHERWEEAEVEEELSVTLPPLPQLPELNVDPAGVSSDSSMSDSMLGGHRARINVAAEGEVHMSPLAKRRRDVSSGEDSRTSIPATAPESVLTGLDVQDCCSQDGCTNPAVEGGACAEHGQFNFLCDYYEDMYDQMPIVY